MKKIIYAALALLVCSCSSGGYTLTGTIEGVMAGDSIMLYSFSATDTPMSAALVSTDGQINLSGSIDGADMAVLVLNNQSEIGMLFVESGDIVVAQNENGAFEFAGTPLNDANVAYSAEVSAIQQNYAALDPDLAAEELLTAQEELYDQYLALTSSTIDANLNNMFGAYLFASGEIRDLEADEAMARIAEFSQEIQALDFMAEIVESIEASLRTEVGQPYTDVNMVDNQGNDVAVSSLLAQGKYVLIDFWATWCGPCMEEMPYLKSAYAQFKDKGFEIYGISLDRSAEDWKSMLDKGDMPWVNVLYTESDNAAELYAVSSIPTNFLISPEGIIVAKNLRGEDIATILGEHIK
ncbi:MAG: TlpA disulfide reductase family protein [Rikenellaceae bacterium]